MNVTFVDAEYVLRRCGVEIKNLGEFEMALCTPLGFGDGAEFIAICAFRSDQSASQVKDLFDDMYPEATLAVVPLTDTPIGSPLRNMWERQHRRCWHMAAEVLSTPRFMSHYEDVCSFVAENAQIQINR